MNNFGNKKSFFQKRSTAAFAILAFMATTILPPNVAALTISTSQTLPPVGTMVNTTKGYHPALVQGISINPENPLNFSFYVSPGDERLD
ncbi:MAG: hypothetical protein K8I00_09000, partial [Candidatus Omnitrophica bacterium]|nr:hypothetical protein [Candidatus Omnitrophota bacterium]